MSGKPKEVPVTDSLTNLYAQKAQAIVNNDTKTANLIQKIIDRLEKKK